VGIKFRGFWTNPQKLVLAKNPNILHPRNFQIMPIRNSESG